MRNETIDSLRFFLCVENLSLDQLDRARLAYPTAHFAVRPATQMPYASISFQPNELSILLNSVEQNAINERANTSIDVLADSHVAWGEFILPPEIIEAASAHSIPVRIAFAISADNHSKQDM